MKRQSVLVHRAPRLWATALVAVFLSTGCSSLGGALSGVLGRAAAGGSQPAAQAAPSPEAPASAAAPASPAQGSPQGRQQAAGASAASYQYQFGAFYGGMWSVGWFGFKDANYAPGQGTVWTFADSKGSSNSASFERAFLKINADGSQWWRFKMDSGKHSLVYELLVGSDSIVRRVRYQDPDSGTIGDFVPDATQTQQPRAQDGRMPRSRAEMAGYLVDRQTLRVGAGSFSADHYLINEVNGAGTSEMWVSDKVPGYMLKAVFTSKKDGKTSTQELTQVENGLTSLLSSY
jgi:hypothetical protein